MDYLKAFIVGGLICMIGQIIFELCSSDIRFASFKANIIQLKPKVLISLCRKAKYHCETCLTISLLKYFLSR